MGANAQTTVPSFVAGNVLTAAQMNNSARTGVPVFADTATRDAAFGGSGEKTLAEGQIAYLEDTDSLFVYDGAAWKQFDTTTTAFTPTWSGLTIGNGSTSGRYCRLGSMVYLRATFTRGSTSTQSGQLTMTLPVNAASGMVGFTVGNIRIIDTGTNIFYGCCNILNTSTLEFITYRSDTQYVTQSLVVAGEPMTWATNDILYAEAWYHV